MQKITPFLFFDDNAEEAAKFYVSVFSGVKESKPSGKSSKIVNVTRYGEAGSAASGMPKGTVMTVEFQLRGQEFVAINGGPHFKFTEAVSFVVHCESQKEVDYFWEKLSEGGDEKAQQCGWLKDRYGLSWQVVPTALTEMLMNSDAHKAERVMKAVLQMKKIEIERLREASQG